MDQTIEQQIKAIEDEIFKTQKNKATEHHIGRLKAKIARLREEADKRKAAAGGKGKGFAVKKHGDATVGIVGFPNIGKSTLLNQLTNASSKVGDYDFTTLETIPGMMQYKGGEIQLLDLPGLILGASQGRGRGREVLSAVRSVDLLLFMVEAQSLEQLGVIEAELYKAGLRVNQRPPDVIVRKQGSGGITVNTTTPLTHISELTVKSIASEFVINAEITVRQNVTEDQLIDSFSQNRVYLPALVIINKSDMAPAEMVRSAAQRIQGKGYDVVAISARTGAGLGDLREKVFLHLRLIRVYMKPVGKKPDYEKPLILREGQTVADACRKIHRDFQRNFRYATIWGHSARHAGQKVGLEHVLQDGDILTLVIAK